MSNPYCSITGKEINMKYGDFTPKVGPTEGQLIATNKDFIATAWDSQWACICILKKNNPHRVPPDVPLVHAHKENITDMRWSPYTKNLLASASEDGTIKFWQIPDNGLEARIDKEVGAFAEHNKKIVTFKFHPSSSELVGSTGFDKTVKVFNINTLKSYNSTPIGDTFTSLDWNQDGSLIGGACKDKHLYVIDPRAKQVSVKTKGSENSKPQKFLFVGPDNFVSTGFGSGRELKLFDLKKPETPVNTLKLDDNGNVPLPFYDWDTNIIYIPSKGSGKVLFYTFTNGNISVLSKEYASPTDQKLFTLEEKKYVDYNSNEMTRMYKFWGKELLFTSFVIPRKSGGIDQSLYPDTFAGESALTGDEWSSGTNKDPIKKNITEL